jgi:hypothetical protein
VERQAGSLDLIDQPLPSREPTVYREQCRSARCGGWAHVRLCSRWSELVDQAAVRLLEPTGWTAPTSGYPTGAQWISSYLQPLAEALGEHVRYGATVTGVSRRSGTGSSARAGPSSRSPSTSSTRPALIRGSTPER